MSTESDMSDLKTEVADLRRDVETLTDSISTLVQAWEAAGLFVSFVKWVAGIVTVALGLYVAWDKYRGTQ